MDMTTAQQISAGIMEEGALVTRAAFAYHASELRYGGDLWNRANILGRIFGDSKVDAMIQPAIFTGLWCDVYVLIGGAWQTRRV